MYFWTNIFFSNCRLIFCSSTIFKNRWIFQNKNASFKITWEIYIINEILIYLQEVLSKTLRFSGLKLFELKSSSVQNYKWKTGKITTLESAGVTRKLTKNLIFSSRKSVNWSHFINVYLTSNSIKQKDVQHQRDSYVWEVRLVFRWNCPCSNTTKI